MRGQSLLPFSRSLRFLLQDKAVPGYHNEARRYFTLGRRFFGFSKKLGVFEIFVPGAESNLSGNPSPME
ncbi:hypothetical protein GCK32_020480 [Trichostrongylus colubriformis]|uniref:Uncharacterized protein n=1 Tax=Trichostrongylus colubriformis TaxID=6319 RepID=A0AAN8EYF2_TRICO